MLEGDFLTGTNVGTRQRCTKQIWFFGFRTSQHIVSLFVGYNFRNTHKAVICITHAWYITTAPGTRIVFISKRFLWPGLHHVRVYFQHAVITGVCLYTYIGTSYIYYIIMRTVCSLLLLRFFYVTKFFFCFPPVSALLITTWYYTYTAACTAQSLQRVLIG